MVFGAGNTGAQISMTSAGWSDISASSQNVNTGGMHCFYKIAGASESTAVQAALTNSGQWRIHALEYSGGFNATPLDQTGSTADTGSTVTSRSSGTSGTTTVADEVVIAFVGLLGTDGGGIAWTNSFVNRTQQTANLIADLFVSSTATYESTASWTTARRAAGAIATFKGSGAVTTNVRDFMSGGIIPFKR